MREQTGHLFKRGQVWHVRFFVKGKPTTRSTGQGNRRQAEIKAAEIVEPHRLRDEVKTLEQLQVRFQGRKAELATLEEKLNPPPPIGDTWHLFLESPSRPDSGEATLRQYGSEWRRFDSWLHDAHPDVAHLRQVTRQHAAAYAADLTAAKVSASTFNQHRNLLRLVWRVLADTARLESNPWDTIAPRKLNALATRKRALTPAQFEALLSATEGDPDLHDLLLLLAWTGLRLVDGLRLRWGAVDFVRGIITLAPQKTARRTGKQVHIPLFPAVREMLNRRQDGTVLKPAAVVFPELMDEYDRDAGATLAKRIGAAFEKAGMETTEERSDRRRGVTVYGAHSLRHFFVTAATAAGMPGAMIKSITGHATDSMLEHYQQIGVDLAGEVAARIGNGKPALPAVAGPSDTPPTIPPTVQAAAKRILEALDAGDTDTARREAEALASQSIHPAGAGRTEQKQDGATEG